MGNLDNILKNNLKRMGIARQVEAVDVVERATKELEKYISKEDFEVISFNRGILKVKVVSSVVASEVQMRAQKIKREIEEIESVRVRG